MDEMIAYCGLKCQTCPILLATRKKDKNSQKEMRIEILRLLREEYGMDYKLEDITDCDGCTAENGRLFSGCKDCPIRKCARQKGIANCAYCEEYVCKTLEAFFTNEPHAKKNLDKLRE